jgi:hypothetical protein
MTTASDLRELDEKVDEEFGKVRERLTAVELNQAGHEKRDSERHAELVSMIRAWGIASVGLVALAMILMAGRSATVSGFGGSVSIGDASAAEEAP